MIRKGRLGSPFSGEHMLSPAKTGNGDWIIVEGLASLVIHFALASATDNDITFTVEAVATVKKNEMTSPKLLTTIAGSSRDTNNANSYAITDNAWAAVRVNCTKYAAGGAGSKAIMSGR